MKIKNRFLVILILCCVVGTGLVINNGRKKTVRQKETESIAQESEMAVTEMDSEVDNVPVTETETETETKKNDTEAGLQHKRASETESTESTEPETPTLIEDNIPPEDFDLIEEQKVTDKKTGKKQDNSTKKSKKEDSRKKGNSESVIEISPSGDAVISLGNDESFSLG